MNDNFHIAPCGMNCSLCLAFQRKNKKCSGCNSPGQDKAGHCNVCRIKHCDRPVSRSSGLCASCTEFPCILIKKLDKRYMTKYGMSMIQNLISIEKDGIASFLDNEKKKWTCHECGSLLCVHRDKCPVCGNINTHYPLRSDI